MTEKKRRTKRFFDWLKPIGFTIVVLAIIIGSTVGVLLDTYVVPKLVNRAVEQGLALVVKNVMPSVVHIRYKDPELGTYGQKVGWQGSGVIINEKGLILTARHVCRKPGRFTVTLLDGREFVTKKACVSREYDVGYLKIDANDLTAAEFGDSDEMRLGSRLLAIGSPWGKQHFNSVTMGILSALTRDKSEKTPSYGWKVLFQTDVAANPGNSGGPVFNMDGKVVGIVVGSYGPGSYAGITYCVPSNVCKSFVLSVWLTFALQEVIPVEANERVDALESGVEVIEKNMDDVEDRIWDLEEDVEKLEFEFHRPFNDGMEWFEK